MTVCIAAIYNESCLLGAADRMLTAGDIQFQPEQSKIYPVTSSIVAMIAGDVSLNVEFYNEVLAAVKARLAKDASKWFLVKDAPAQPSVRHSSFLRATSAREDTNTQAVPARVTQRLDHHLGIPLKPRLHSTAHGAFLW